MVKAWLAGLFIALGAMGAQMAPDKFLGAAIFPVGLILCYFVGGDLFTGKNLLIGKVYNKELSLVKFIKKLLSFYIGNLVGAGIVGSFVNLTNIIPNTEQALYKTTLAPHVIIAKAIFCNVCVCLAVYAAQRQENPTAKIILLYFPTMLFVLCGFEHCVANMYYLSATGNGVFSGGFWYSQLFSVIGNLIGGLGVSTILWKKDYIEKFSKK